MVGSLVRQHGQCYFALQNITGKLRHSWRELLGAVISALSSENLSKHRTSRLSTGADSRQGVFSSNKKTIGSDRIPATASNQHQHWMGANRMMLISAVRVLRIQCHGYKPYYRAYKHPGLYSNISTPLLISTHAYI